MNLPIRVSRRFLRLLLMAGAVLLPAILLQAQEAEPLANAPAYELSWWTVDGGGSTGPASSLSYNLVGTIGQPDAGVMEGPHYGFVGGFWAGLPAAPVAYFEAYPTSGPVPLEVTFTDESAGGPTGWAWDFGDGGTSTEQDPVYTYTAAGTYTVILTATNQYGSHTRTMNDYITVTEPQAPEAHFSASPTSGLAPLNVAFTDQSSNNPTSWAWDFGDGGSSTVQDPEYTYQTGGTFTVTLTVSNDIGSDTLIQPNLITVQEAERIYLPLVVRNAP